LTKDNYEIWCIHVKAWLGSQDVWETIKKGFEEFIEGATLTLAQREAMQKARRND
jgi:hypothetical protein